MGKVKWYTYTEYYDEEGIQISKEEVKKKYIIIKKHIKHEVNGEIGIKTFWNECKRNNQLELW